MLSHEKCVARISAQEPDVHAFVYIDDAATAEGLLVAIKANIAVAGWPFHAGIGAYRGRVAARDAACVARLRAAGAVLVGLTNMDEAALGDVTDNFFYGRTVNPRRPGFTAGGSSGGSAAAVAAGFCAVALGTDTLGSVRIPASYCGVVGHKLPHGTLSMEGIVALAPQWDSVGILAADLAQMALVRRWLGPVGPDSDARAIGIFPLDGVDMDPGVAGALADVAARAAQRGYRLHHVPKLQHGLREIARAAFLLVSLRAAEEHAAAFQRDPLGFSAAFADILAWAGRQPAARIAAARDIVAQTAAEIRTGFAPFAAVLMPATPHPAFAFDGARPESAAWFTCLANIAGFAATSFPVRAVAANGLPLAVQLVGADEAACLRVAGELF